MLRYIPSIYASPNLENSTKAKQTSSFVSQPINYVFTLEPVIRILVSFFINKIFYGENSAKLVSIVLHLAINHC